MTNFEKNLSLKNMTSLKRKEKCKKMALKGRKKMILR